MANLYERASAGGRTYKLVELVARHAVTQDGLASQTARVAHKATAVLVASRDNDHAKIRTDRGRINHYVVLDDTDGRSAAMTIEYGRRGDTLYKKGPRKGQPVPASNAVAPLRLAMGMSRTTVGANRVRAKSTSKAAAKRIAKRKGS